MSYIIAAIYQGINKRVKNDTPYFNTLMLFFIGIFIHIFQILIVLKIFHIDLLHNITQGEFMIFFILLAVFTVILLMKVFPFAKISKISVTEKDIRRYYNLAISYLMLSILLMMFLLFELKKSMIISTI